MPLNLPRYISEARVIEALSLLVGQEVSAAGIARVTIDLGNIRVETFARTDAGEPIVHNMHLLRQVDDIMVTKTEPGTHPHD